MAKYKLACLPGDGIGVDVLKAARIVLDESSLMPNLCFATQHIGQI
jgi:isocitrate/isopropylmalate dehydrogenase